MKTEKESGLIPDDYFTKTYNIMFQIYTDVYYMGSDGEIKEGILDADSKHLYNYLLSHVNVTTYKGTGKHNKIYVSTSTIGKAMRWKGRTKIKKVTQNLVELGLIRVEGKDGSTHRYYMTGFYDSKILYAHKKENGEYHHKEVDHMIDEHLKSMSKKNNPVQSDPPKAKKNAKGYPDHSHKDDYEISPEDRKKYGSFLDEEIPV